MNDLEDLVAGVLTRVADAVDVRDELEHVRRDAASTHTRPVEHRSGRVLAAAAAVLVAVGLVAAGVRGGGSPSTDPVADGSPRAYPILAAVPEPLVGSGESSVVRSTDPVAQSSGVLVGRRSGRGVLDGAVVRAFARRPPSLDSARGVRTTFGERSAIRFVEAGVTTFVLDGGPTIVVSGADPSWLASAHVSLSARMDDGVPELLVGPLPSGVAIVVVGAEGPTPPMPTVTYAGPSGERLLLWTTVDDPRLAIGALGDLRPVTIAGHPGWAVSRAGATVLAWEAAPGVTVVVDTSLPLVGARRAAAAVRLVDAASWHRRYGDATSSTATTRACLSGVVRC